MKINRWRDVVQGASEVSIHRWDALIFACKGLCCMRSISCRMTATNGLALLFFTCRRDREETTLCASLAAGFSYSAPLIIV